MTLATTLGEMSARDADHHPEERKTSSLGYPCQMSEFRERLPEDWDGCVFHRLIFLHAPKTGGESVEYALKSWKSHDMASDVAAGMTDEDWHCAFKFSTVRNPWARWESWYSFCNAGHGDPPRLPTPQWACLWARRLSLSEFTTRMITVLKWLQDTRPDNAKYLRWEKMRHPIAVRCHRSAVCTWQVVRRLDTELPS